MSPEFQVQHIADPHIDYAEEALIPLLELALVEYLDSDDGRVLNSARGIMRTCSKQFE